MKRRFERMRTGVTLVMMGLCGMWLTLATGCNAALKEGFDDGVSSVVSAIIQAPINFVLEHAFQ